MIFVVKGSTSMAFAWGVLRKQGRSCRSGQCRIRERAECCRCSLPSTPYLRACSDRVHLLVAAVHPSQVGMSARDRKEDGGPVKKKFSAPRVPCGSLMRGIVCSRQFNLPRLKEETGDILGQCEALFQLSFKRPFSNLQCLSAFFEILQASSMETVPRSTRRRSAFQLSKCCKRAPDVVSHQICRLELLFHCKRRFNLVSKWTIRLS